MNLPFLVVSFCESTDECLLPVGHVLLVCARIDSRWLNLLLSFCVSPWRAQVRLRDCCSCRCESLRGACSDWTSGLIGRDLCWSVRGRGRRFSDFGFPGKAKLRRHENSVAQRTWTTMWNSLEEIFLLMFDRWVSDSNEAFPALECTQRGCGSQCHIIYVPHRWVFLTVSLLPLSVTERLMAILYLFSAKCTGLGHRLSANWRVKLKAGSQDNKSLFAWEPTGRGAGISDQEAKEIFQKRLKTAQVEHVSFFIMPVTDSLWYSLNFLSCVLLSKHCRQN